MPLHPQVKGFLDDLRASNVPDWPALTPAEGREVFAGLAALFGQGPALKRVEDRRVAGTVPIRIYTPAAAAPLPVVLYFHGGGWVLGGLDTHDTLCRRLSVGASCSVVAVDYRRAPEHPYPAALDDCYAATACIAGHAAEFGVDAGRLVVAGDSAGGNLAAAVALKARDLDGPAIHAQVLIYPALEPRCATGSYNRFADGHGLTREAMCWFWRQYLGHDDGAADGYAAPARAASLARLPPTHVITAEFDVLRDEGEEFAARLREAGVPTTLRRYDGMIHGFAHFSEPFDVGRQAVADLAAVVHGMTNGRALDARGKVPA